MNFPKSLMSQAEKTLKIAAVIISKRVNENRVASKSFGLFIFENSQPSKCQPTIMPTIMTMYQKNTNDSTKLVKLNFKVIILFLSQLQLNPTILCPCKTGIGRIDGLILAKASGSQTARRHLLRGFQM